MTLCCLKEAGDQKHGILRCITLSTQLRLQSVKHPDFTEPRVSNGACRFVLTQQMSSVSGDSWQTHEGYGFRWSAIGISCFEASFTKLVGYLLGSQIEQNKTFCPKTPRKLAIKERLEFLVTLSSFWISKELPFGEKIMGKRSPLNRPFHMALLCWLYYVGSCQQVFKS